MRLFSHLRQKQFEAANLSVARQSSFVDRYLRWLDAGAEHRRGDRTITVIARSPLSPVMRALVGRIDELKAHRVTARALLAQVEPDDTLLETVETLSGLRPDQPIGELARWVSNTCLLDAHEQITLGTTMCWSGDMMRRDPGKRDGLDLFETEAPQTVRLGVLAFHAIWSLAAPIPGSRLRARQPRPNAALVQEIGAGVPKPVFLRHEERPRLTRH